MQDATQARREEGIARLRVALLRAAPPTVRPAAFTDEEWLDYLERTARHSAWHRPSAAARALEALRYRHLAEEATLLAELLNEPAAEGQPESQPWPGG